MFLVNIIILLLAIRNGVKPEEVAEWGSGDGRNVSPTTRSYILIDENGDITIPSTETQPIDAIAESDSESVVDRDVNETNENDSVALMPDNTDDETTTTTSPTSSTDAFDVIIDETTVETTSTDLPTTEATTETVTTTTISTSTVSDPSTTEASTTDFAEVSTVPTVQTTTFISTTTVMVKTEKSIGYIPQSSTTEETHLPDEERQPCEPENEDFHCRIDFQCYGEGEIDCSLRGDDKRRTHKDKDESSLSGKLMHRDNEKNGDTGSDDLEPTYKPYPTLYRSTAEEMITSPSPQEADDVSTATPDETIEEIANSRRKRYDFYNDRVLQLIEKKYTDGGLCRLHGNIKCTPRPTYADCRGRTFCKAVKRTTEAASETAQSSSAPGLKSWVISVITICAFFGVMTIFMIIYLLATSCKKLKVQPTPDVTTLNYITRKGENPETA